MTNPWSKLPEELRKRIASYVWRAAGLAAVAFLNSLAEGLTGLGLSPFWVAAAGLALGEVTKWFNGRLQAKY